MNYHAIFIRHSKIDAIYPHYSLMQLTNTSTQNFTTLNVLVEHEHERTESYNDDEIFLDL